MALNLRSPEADAIATELARLTGQTKTRVVTEALRERLAGLCRERLPATPVDPAAGAVSPGCDPASPPPPG